MIKDELKTFVKSMELTEQERLFAEWLTDFTGILKFADRKKIIIKLKSFRKNS